MNTKKILPLLAAAMLAAGCAPDNEPGAPVGEAVRFTASIAAVATPETPATRTENGGDSWVQNDPVGIFMLKPNGSPAISGDVLAGNAEYKITDAQSGALAPNSGTPIYYPQSGTVDFVAYYPWSNAASTGTLDLTVAGQTTEVAQNALDVLYARTPGQSKSNAAVALSFGHVLSKVTLDVKLGDGLTALGGDDITAVVFGGMPVDAALDLEDGTLTPSLRGGETDEAIQARASWIASTPEESRNDVMATFTALLIPHTGTAGRTATITVDGEDYVGTIPDGDDFEAGEHYTYTVTVSLTGVTVSAPGIAPWDGTDDPDNAAGSGEAEIIWPTNSRITWDAAANGGNGGYTLTTDPHDAGLYFKFGSVAGVFSGNHGNQILPGTNYDVFDTGDVAWSPVGVNDNWDNSVPSGDTSHTVANVIAGKGDPCRLVGLDLAAIKAAAVGTLTPEQIDNGTWRLPTRDENVEYVGEHTYPAGWQILDGVNGHKFPDDDTFLPAAGYRDYSNGSVLNQGTHGYYWSSTATSGSSGYYLGFGSGYVDPSYGTNYAFGFGVRCVRQ